MLEGLTAVLAPEMLVTLLLGTIGGAFVGGLPGLSATMAVALLVPFTFTLGPAAGLVAIGGLYVGSMYGGAIPACLINTPGTPSALATTFDGFPLTLQGKGQHALVTAGISSAAGALIGGFALLLLSPALAEFSLRFGPPEFFWVGIFGLTLIATLASGSLSKALAGGALGMLLSTIGIAPALAQARYTFGIPGCWADSTWWRRWLACLPFLRRSDWWKDTSRRPGSPSTARCAASSGRSLVKCCSAQ